MISLRGVMPPSTILRRPRTVRTAAVKPYNHHSTKHGTQVYVKHLPETITKDEFFELFVELDNLVDHRLIMKDGKCDGFGFAVFSTKQAAEKAVAMLHGKKRLPNGRLLHVRIVEQNNVFVKNLHAKVAWKMLFGLFATHGTLKYVHVIINERGFSRGYSTGRAIVSFVTPEAASRAIAKMNGHVLYGKPMCVERYKSSYELRKEKFHTYFGSKQHEKLTTGSRSKNGSSKTTNAASDDSIDPNDVASIKQTYANRLSAFAQHSHPAKYEEIAELLLEYDNDQLKAFFEAPRRLQTAVDNAATLLTIRQLMH